MAVNVMWLASVILHHTPILLLPLLTWRLSYAPRRSASCFASRGGLTALLLVVFALVALYILVILLAALLLVMFLLTTLLVFLLTEILLVLSTSHYSDSSHGASLGALRLILFLLVCV